MSPSAALTVPESTLRLSRDLWHLPGSTRRAAAGRLVTHHLGSGPGMIISVVTTASCPRPHRLRADHCLLTPGTFGLKLTQPAGSFPRPPCRRQPVVAPLLKRGLALSRALVFPCLIQITVPANALLPLCPLRFHALLAGMQRLDPSATTQGTPALAASLPPPPAGTTAVDRECPSSSHVSVRKSPPY